MSKRDLPWEHIFARLRKTAESTVIPSVTLIAGEGPNPYRVLISTLISLRTRDEVTIAASQRLFSEASSPTAMLALSRERIESLIYPAGFYRRKAGTIQAVSRILIEEYGGRVPADLSRLTALPGVGRKTANLTLGLAFGIPAICVDTHVHRIPNRLGWIRTSTPDQSETALAEILPERYWIEINTLLVAFGKQICTPLSPRCGRCPLAAECEKVDVDRSRD